MISQNSHVMRMVYITTYKNIIYRSLPSSLRAFLIGINQTCPSMSSIASMLCPPSVSLTVTLAPLFSNFCFNLYDSPAVATVRSEEHTSELQSRFDLVCRLLLEKKKKR